MANLIDLCSGLPLDPLPTPRDRDPDIPHAPDRNHGLSGEEKKVVVFFSQNNVSIVIALIKITINKFF